MIPEYWIYIGSLCSSYLYTRVFSPFKLIQIMSRQKPFLSEKNTETRLERYVVTCIKVPFPPFERVPAT